MMPVNFSPAGQSLGLNNLGQIPGLGDALADQTGTETEELRKRRMLEQQQRGLLGTGGSAAASSLFGSGLAGIGGVNGTGRLF
jgi:hypothetical protein